MLGVPGKMCFWVLGPEFRNGEDLKSSQEGGKQEVSLVPDYLLVTFIMETEHLERRLQKVC